MKTVQDRVIEKLRQRSGLGQADVPDIDLIRAYKGTLSMSLVQLEIAMEDFSRASRAATREAIKSLQEFSETVAIIKVSEKQKGKNKKEKHQ